MKDRGTQEKIARSLRKPYMAGDHQRKELSDKVTIERKKTASERHRFSIT
jgi:hypothetical protein